MHAALSRRVLIVAVISLLILAAELAVNGSRMDPSILVTALAITALPVVTALRTRLGVALLTVVLAVLMVTEIQTGMLWFIFPLIVGLAAVRGRVWLAAYVGALLAVFEIVSALTADSAFQVDGLVVTVIINGAVAAMGSFVHRSNLRAAADAAATRARREALSWKLHDNVVNSLTSIVTRAELHALSLGEQSAHYTEARRIADAARGSVSELRTLVRALNQQENQGKKEGEEKTVLLRNAMDSAVDQLKAVGFDVMLHSFDDDPRVFLRHADVVGECLGEAVVNIIKYGDRAYPVSINVRITSELLTIRITNAIVDKASVSDSTGLGLLSMSAKLSAAGGRMAVQDRSGEWLLQLEVPAT